MTILNWIYPVSYSEFRNAFRGSIFHSSYSGLSGLVKELINYLLLLIYYNYGVNVVYEDIEIIIEKLCVATKKKK